MASPPPSKIVLEYANSYPETWKPARYGLGEWGWVSISFDRVRSVSVALLRAWIAESYQAIAPKQLAAQLKARG